MTRDITRIRRDLSRYGIGMLQIRSGTRDRKEYERRYALVSKLIETGQLDLLRALKGGRLSIEELIDNDRRDRLMRTADDLLVRRPLWTTIDATLPRMGKTRETRQRYHVSFSALQRSCALRVDATVDDLRLVEWGTLAESWGRSAADWNHVRRAVSRFLSVLLGDVYHPFRREIVKRIPLAAEPSGRVPDITPAKFWEIVHAMPEYVRAAPVVLVVTGMRVRREYLKCDKSNLRPQTCQVIVPGKTKGKAPQDVVSVDERLWPWIEAGIPAPLGYSWTRKHWNRACHAVGVGSLTVTKDARGKRREHYEGPTLHDLRHCLGQWTTDEGVPEKAVQSMLRHATASQTRRYTKSVERGVVAKTVANVLARKA